MSDLQTTATVLAEGLGWAEGPTVLPDGRICFVESYRSQVTVWSPDGEVRQYADTKGGPNACVLAADGSILVTQNGGTTGPWRAAHQVAASIQRIPSEGAEPEELATEVDGYQLNGPNDLVFGPDGLLYFTDPGEYRPADPQPSRIFVLNMDGTGRLLVELDPPTFPNGIAVDPAGKVYWAESYTGLVKTLDDSGKPQTIAKLTGDNPVPDGMAIAENGDLYVTDAGGANIEVISPAGELRRRIPFGVVPTNCVFDGTGRLIVTDSGTVANSTEPAFEGKLYALDLGLNGAGTWFGPSR